MAPDTLSAFDGIARELREVDRAISRAMESDEEALSKIADHVVSSGGKRIRPALLLLAYMAANGRAVKKVVPAAAAIEVIHTASLIHDDISDKSAMRRGKPSAHVSFGVARSLIAADYLMTAAFNLAGQYGMETIRTINHACMQMAIGEIQDLRHSADADLTRAKYIQIIDRKTGSLIEAGVRIGVMLAGASPQDVDHFGTYGRNVGLAFQIIDDTLDVSATAGRLGKPVGKDLREGKVTLPVIIALERLQGKDRAFLREVVAARDGVPSQAKVKQCLKLIRSVEAEALSRKVARQYTKRAKRAIAGYRKTSHLKELNAFADELVEREA
jgi:octaprenyl-diphosphate synthase